VNECIGGLIPYEDRGYSTVARCPRCDRAKDQSGLPATGIPTYTGRVTFRSKEEMDRRREERRVLIEDHGARRERGREFFAELQRFLDVMDRGRKAEERAGQQATGQSTPEEVEIHG
jgi:hypothetical protein